MYITNSTFSGNGASGGGGGIYGGTNVVLENSIVANSTAGGNCGGSIQNGLGNLSYPDVTCPGTNRDPMLNALGNNGGPTQTMALRAGSPAIDSAVASNCASQEVNNLDQRGYSRPVDGNGDKVAVCDMGAFEYLSAGPPSTTPDEEPPKIWIDLDPAAADGANGWFRSPVTINPKVLDESPVIGLRCTLDPEVVPTTYDELPDELCPFLGAAQPVSADGEHAFYAAAMDLWGNKSAVVSAAFKIDATPPVLTCPVAGPFLLGSGDQPVGPAAVDASVSSLDEAASTLSGIVTTENVGPKTLTFTAVDLAGNSASRECTYAVIYAFDGFYPPVEPAPALNDAKAGQAIPLKFSLAGDQGLDIIAEGYPASQPVECATLEPAGPLVATQPPGNSGLRYAAGNGGYVYVWKTDKAWAGMCRALVLLLVDGTDHPAYFQFK
jgi:predicted outer membrane repeat protein